MHGSVYGGPGSGPRPRALHQVAQVLSPLHKAETMMHRAKSGTMVHGTVHRVESGPKTEKSLEQLRAPCRGRRHLALGDKCSLIRPQQSCELPRKGWTWCCCLGLALNVPSPCWALWDCLQSHFRAPNVYTAIIKMVILLECCLKAAGQTWRMHPALCYPDSASPYS